MLYGANDWTFKKNKKMNLGPSTGRSRPVLLQSIWKGDDSSFYRFRVRNACKFRI